MISQFGMSEDFDMVAMQNGQSVSWRRRNFACSFETQTLIDKKSGRTGKSSQHDKALKILQDNIESFMSWLSIF